MLKANIHFLLNPCLCQLITGWLEGNSQILAKCPYGGEPQALIRRTPLPPLTHSCLAGQFGRRKTTFPEPVFAPLDIFILVCSLPKLSTKGNDGWRIRGLWSFSLACHWGGKLAKTQLWFPSHSALLVMTVVSVCLSPMSLILS